MIVCFSKHQFGHLLCAKPMSDNVDKLREFSRKCIRKERQLERCKSMKYISVIVSIFRDDSRRRTK